MALRLAALCCVLSFGLSINVFAQSENGMGGTGGRPSFAPAAQALGVTEQELMTALRLGEDGPPDFAGATKKLGISEEKIKAVMPPPPERASPE